MNLLIKESPLVVCPTLAKIIGLNEAIILQQIQYWIEINSQQKRNYHNGRYWTYNSVPEWHKQFPFWCEKTVKRTLSSLRSSGLILAEPLSNNTLDRTLWYSIDHERLESLILSFQKKENGSGQRVPDAIGTTSPPAIGTTSPDVYKGTETNLQRLTTETSKKRASEIVKSGGDSQDFYERFRLTYNERKPASFAEMQICNKARQKVIDAFVADCGGKENALVALSNALAFCQSDPWYQSKDLSFDNLATKGKLLSLHERQISKELSGIPPELNNDRDRAALARKQANYLYLLRNAGDKNADS